MPVMPPPRSPKPPLVATVPTLKRNLGLWWRRQSPARQDRFATLGPLLSVLLFLAAIISAFWYLRNEEFEREAESVKRDTEITQQQIGLRLIQNQEQMVRLAGSLSARPVSGEALLPVIEAFSRDRPEVTHMAWYDVRRRPLAVHWAPLHHGALPPDNESSRVSRPIDSVASAPETAFRACLLYTSDAADE